MLRVLTPLVYLLLYLLSAPAFADRQPNVLLLLADDFGYNDSALYQSLTQQQPVMSMPALEALARQGTRYSRFYTESTCSASRAALLTGQYAARNGFMPIARGVSADVFTLPEFLQSRGYATHLVGKWHVGEINQQAFPENQGFDSVFGFLGQWFLKGPDANGVQELKSPTYYNPWLRDTDAKQKTSYKQYPGHLEDILTERTVTLIQQGKNSTQPWFVYHAFFAPHTPFEPNDFFAKQFANTPAGKYRALLAQMDANLRHIFTALKDSGQWDNTIIIFVSDNGSPDKAGNSNAPFYGVKTEYEEGGIRTPLVIKWQNALQATAATNRTDVVSMMDIYPSLAAALGASLPPAAKVDGIASLIPSRPVQRTTPLYFLTYGSLSVLSADGHYRLLRQWDAVNFTRSQLFKYDDSGLPMDISGNWREKISGSYNKRQMELFDNFLQWRNRLRVVPTRIQGHSVSGSDFLRTPVNPSFALLFSFTAPDVAEKQILLSQENSLSVYLEKGSLYASIHGLPVKAEAIKPDVCYSVVLSGDFYDRFSGVHNDIKTSHLHLIVNGNEVDKASGAISSFAALDVTAPTVIGKTTAVMSAPVFLSTQLLPDDKPIPSDFAETSARFNACRAE